MDWKKLTIISFISLILVNSIFYYVSVNFAEPRSEKINLSRNSPSYINTTSSVRNVEIYDDKIYSFHSNFGFDNYTIDQYTTQGDVVWSITKEIVTDNTSSEGTLISADKDGIWYFTINEFTNQGFILNLIQLSVEDGREIFQISLNHLNLGFEILDDFNYNFDKINFVINNDIYLFVSLLGHKLDLEDTERHFLVKFFKINISTYQIESFNINQLEREINNFTQFRVTSNQVTKSMLFSLINSKEERVYTYLNFQNENIQLTNIEFDSFGRCCLITDSGPYSTRDYGGPTYQNFLDIENQLTEEIFKNDFYLYKRTEARTSDAKGIIMLLKVFDNPESLDGEIHIVNFDLQNGIDMYNSTLPQDSLRSQFFIEIENS